MLVAIYEIEVQGKTNEQAVADLVSFGHGLLTPARASMQGFLLTYVRGAGGETGRD
ncbi:MAG TPA: hypothetical protein QF764_13865 [Planctomycetota bacterium]|jgi:hypothetical protein|nr:hypothetical protein [Planctomycetota bacterium]MDP7691920.1 hypothetical protein [Vicinamibacterales bacterium]HJP02850.1 hypothetical protein [Planctomycetota bacterium]